MHSANKLAHAGLIISLSEGSTRLFGKIFREHIVVVFPDDLKHGTTEIVQVPSLNFLMIILLEHHRIVDLAGVVRLFKFFRQLDIKRLNDDSSPGSLLLLMALFLLWRSIFILFICLYGAITTSWLRHHLLTVGNTTFVPKRVTAIFAY